MQENIADRCAAYLRHKMPQVTDLSVSKAGRIFGGASCETYRVLAHWHEDGVKQKRGLIFRRSSEAGLLETRRDIEYYAYLVMHNAGLPVPKPYYIETEST